MTSLAEYQTKLQKLVAASEHAQGLVRLGWAFRVSKGGRGFCYTHKRLITIPRHALDCSWGAGYDIYYLHHEIAHALANTHRHGLNFMEALIRICPCEVVHYELTYKPRNARAAGIQPMDRAPAKRG